MKRKILLILMRVIRLLPLKRIIVFESTPDFACNTYPVFVELRQRLPQYKMVWKTKHNTPPIEGVDDNYFYDDKGLWNLFKKYYYWCFAKAFVTSNLFIGSIRPKQVSLYLTHGSKTKNTRGKYEPGPFVDYINSQSHFFDDVQCYGYNARKEQIVYLGFPRCDYLFKDNNIAQQLHMLGIDGNYIIWLPTFRKNKSGKRNVHSDTYEQMGIPLIYSFEKLKDFNRFLKQKSIHVIYKPHPAQDISGLTKTKWSHIHVISDQILYDISIQLYQVLAESKALITDYSSVFFDYLLLDRPMATTTDDLSLWKQGEGFAFDLEAMYSQAAEQVATLEELYHFISEVVIEGKDDKHEARQNICHQTTEHIDGDSTRRVADFILEKIGEISQ